jgi:serine/threonine protein kinase
MDYIHSFGIIHGDLKLGNVLLKTHRVDRRGYVAKVSDFGMYNCSALHAVQAIAYVSMCKRMVVQGTCEDWASTTEHVQQAGVHWD